MANHTDTLGERGCHNTENPEDITTEVESRATKTDMCGLLSLGVQVIVLCISAIKVFNTLMPRQDGYHFASNIFKGIYFNENVWISIKWYWSVFLFKVKAS